jgi:hypothetical protein
LRQLPFPSAKPLSFSELSHHACCLQRIVQEAHHILPVFLAETQYLHINSILQLFMKMPFNRLQHFVGNKLKSIVIVKIVLVNVKEQSMVFM